MVSIQDAVGNAVKFAQETLGAARATGLQLEEVESGHADGGDAWLITLSLTNRNPFGPRDYKRFFVLKESGAVVAMRIRELTPS